MLLLKMEKTIEETLLKAIQEECKKRGVSIERFCSEEPHFKNKDERRLYYYNKKLEEEKRSMSIHDPIGFNTK